MSNKKIVIVVILIIIILLLIGLLVYILYKNNTENACRINAINNAITTFESLNESVSSQVNNTTDNNTISSNVINSTEENSIVENSTNNALISESTNIEEKIKNVAIEFINAVNLKDWDTARNYASASAVETVKKYNLTDFTIDYSSYEPRKTSEKTYDEVEYCIDQILEIEENIIKLSNKFASYDERNKKVDKIVAKTDNCKTKIADYFTKAQNLIIKNYFDKAFKNISNLEELDNYRKNLEHYKELIGRTDDYTFFDDYYTEKMSALEHKSNVLENGGIETALEYRKPTNKLLSIFRAIKNFVTGEKIHN